MLLKSSLVFLFIFTYAFTQSNRPAMDTAVTYKRSLEECKTWADSLAYYKANINVSIGLLKLRNDSGPSRVIRDTLYVIDTSKIKIP